jgi:hypothetical protein
MAKEKSVTIPLDFPLELADRKLDAVTIQRPTMGDLEDYPVNAGTGLKEEMALVAHLCGLHAEDLRQMDAEDYDKLQKQLLLFRGISLDKGKKA